MRGRRVAALLGLAIAAMALAVPARAELPLGSRSFSERSRTVGLAPGLSWTRIVRGGGPWRVNVLAIDRRTLGGRLAAVLSNSRVARRERASSMARRRRALAGVNGGFFAADGDPVGALAVGGRLVSEPVRGRSALLLPGVPEARARVSALRFAGEVTIGGRSRLLDGIDRRPGRIPACGGRGGDRPTQAPNSVRTCTDPSELVVLSSSYGARTPRGGVELLVKGGVAASRGRAAAHACRAAPTSCGGVATPVGFCARRPSPVRR